MNDNFLTPDGQRRRSQILNLALAESRRHRRRRWIAPVAGTAIVVTIIGLSIVRPRQPQIAPPTIVRVTPSPATPPGIAIEYLTTDPTITDRLSIPPQPPTWTTMDDHELLTELADAGQPAGLAYVNGRAILLRQPR